MQLYPMVDLNRAVDAVSDSDDDDDDDSRCLLAICKRDRNVLAIINAE